MDIGAETNETAGTGRVAARSRPLPGHLVTFELDDQRFRPGEIAKLFWLLEANDDCGCDVCLDASNRAVGDLMAYGWADRWRD